MKKIDSELLLSRGFRSEKELNDFLKNCNDESWIKELKEYYGLLKETEEEIEEETEEVKEEETEEVKEETKKSKK